MAENLSAKQVALWQDRLRFAKASAMEHGVIGTRHPSHMRILIEMYRGNQWRHIGQWAGVSEGDLAVINKIFPTLNGVVGQVGARNPEIEVLPYGPEDEEAAPGVELLINRDLRELRWARQTNDCLADHGFAPYGLLQHGFTPSEEYHSEGGTRLQLYGRAKPDRPWVRRRAPWNVLLDPRAERFHVDGGMRWVAFRDLMSLAQIRDNPKMIRREKLKGGNVDPAWHEMPPLADRNARGDDPDQNEFIEVWSVYEIEEKTWFQITWDVPEALREPDDWPIAWEDLPVSIFSVNEQRDTPYALSLMDQMIPGQEELNKLRTIASTLARQIRRIVLIAEEGLADGEKNKLTDPALFEFILKKLGSDNIMEQVQVGGLPQELLVLSGQAEEDIRELGGQSRMGRGQRINVETAHEASFVQQGQDVHTARIAGVYEAFHEHAVRLYMQARRETMRVQGVTEQVRLSPQDVGDEALASLDPQRQAGVFRWVAVSPQSMAGSFEIGVRVGSTRPKDREREAQKALADLQVGMAVGPNIADVPSLWFRYARARGIDPAQVSRPNARRAGLLQSIEANKRTANPEEETTAPDAAAVAASLQAEGGGAVQ